MKYKLTKLFNGQWYADAVNPYEPPLIQNGQGKKIISQDTLYWEFEETNFIIPAYGFEEEGEYEEGKDCSLLSALQARFIANLNGQDYKSMPSKGNVLIKLKDREGNYTSIEDLGHVHASKWAKGSKDYEQKYAEFMYAFMLGAENMKNAIKQQEEIEDLKEQYLSDVENLKYHYAELLKEYATVVDNEGLGNNLTITELWGKKVNIYPSFAGLKEQ